MIRTATVTLRGVTPYSQSRNYEREHPKQQKETHEDWRKRTWRHHLHSDERGVVYIPSMAIKNCLSECAKFLSLQVPGKGKKTYTKAFEVGVIVPEHASLGIKAAEVASEDLHLPADGRRGSGKRIWKTYPVIPAGWRTSVQVLVGEDSLTSEIFEQVLREAGRFVGVGRFRPFNNGFYGRFEVESIKWS